MVPAGVLLRYLVRAMQNLQEIDSIRRSVKIVELNSRQALYSWLRGGLK